MSKGRIAFVLGLLLTTSPGALAGGANDASLPAGCVAHMQPVKGGEIDWGGGYIIAIGRGEAKGNTDQDRYMARRAAEVVAARNVLAVACGVQVDADGCLADVSNGEIRLRGVVKRHKVISTEWRPNETPPTCIVKMRAPLWGARGAATIVCDSVCAKARRQSARRLSLAATPGLIEETIIMIDARGIGMQPCMFPRVMTDGGMILYDVATISDRRVELAPPMRFVETRMSHEELRAEAIMQGAWPAVESVSNLDGVMTFCSLSPDPATMLFGPPQRVPTTQPTTRPATTQSSEDDGEDGSSRRRKRRVVKALKTTAGNNTQIVLTKEDAERLRNDPNAAAALKSGRVIVVVDSVAAGIEGHGPKDWDDRVLALAERG